MPPDDTLRNISVIFLPEMYSLSLLTRKHQTQIEEHSINDWPVLFKIITILHKRQAKTKNLFQINGD